MAFAMQKSTYVALILLVTGSAIYATCRQDVILLAPLRGTKFLECLKIDIQHQKGNIFTYFLLFCLPDVLWYSALLLIQKQYYNQSIAGKGLLYVAMALPFILEFMQYFGVLSGTFDIVDVSFYVLTLLCFLILWKRKKL